MYLIHFLYVGTQDRLIKYYLIYRSIGDTYIVCAGSSKMSVKLL